MQYDPFCLACKSELRASQYKRKLKLAQRKPREDAALDMANCEVIEAPVLDVDRAEVANTALRNHAFDSLFGLEHRWSSN